MRLDIYPNFASQEEIDALNAWAELGVKNKWLDAGISQGTDVYTKRLTSRFYGNRFEYPQVVLDLSRRVREFVGVSSFPFVAGHGRDGVVVSYTYPGGDVYKHKDPGGMGMATLRCNILTQKADAGCQLYVDNTPVNIGVGDLHCYLASEHEHWTTPVEGITPRIMWMFGANVPAEDWNSGKIKSQQLNN